MAQGSGLLKDRVLFLAGVGPQMGAATARIAAREGARVALAARTEGLAQEVAEAIRAGGGSAIALPCDLTRDDDIRAGLSGNLCRCTGYEHIVAAVRAARDAR